MTENIPIISYMQKTDSAKNWETIEYKYIPYKGEIIVYQDDYYSSFKIGDGVNYLGNLPYFGSLNLRQGTQPNSIILGTNGLAEGINSISEGNSSKAYGDHTHAMGSATIAMGNNSVSMGTNTQAHGLNSHAEGKSTQAHGANSHAEGEGTITIEDCGHVQGRYNSSDSGYAHVVGNGTSSDNPSDAYTLDWDGNAWFSGDVSLKSGHKLSEKVNSSQIAPMVNNVIANTLSEKTTLKIYFDDNTYSEFEVYQNNSKQNIEY